MNLGKFKYSYKKYGVTGFINVFFGKIGIKYRIENHFTKTIGYYSDQIEKVSKNKIIYGNYKGTKIFINKSWNNFDLPSKYLGTYELEVQNLIIASQKKKKKKYLINLGCGEGYHSISLLKKNIFKKTVGFESDKIAQSFFNKNLEANNLKNKAIMFANADINFLKKNVFKKLKFKDCFFLIDIEGGEFDILDNSNLKLLKESKLIIEIHDFYKSPKKLLILLKKYFRITIISTEHRNPSKFKILDEIHDNEKWILMSEGRPKKMQWVFCEPK
jgi:precorrin-6B methylase 2